MKNESTSDIIAKGFIYTSGFVAALVIGTLIILYGAWAGAFVGTHLWLWFVVPTFEVAPLTMPQAFGLALLVGYWTYHFRAGQKDERDKSKKVIEFFGIIAGPWITLLIGYICHHFFM